MAARSAKATRHATPKRGQGSKASVATSPERSAKQDKTSLAKLLSHPMRVQILAASHRAEISPSEFAKAHDEPISRVSPHFKKLAEYGAIKLVRTEPIRGSVRHVYVGTKRGILTASDWRNLPGSVQGGIAGAGLQDFVGVTVDAIDSGCFTERSDFVFTWDEAKLDQPAWEKLVKMLGLVWQKIPGLEDEAELRREQGNNQSMSAIVGLAAFPAPEPRVASPVKGGARSKRSARRD